LQLLLDIRFPGIQDIVMEIETEQLSWLLSGLDFSRFKPLPAVQAKHFY